MKKLPIGSFQWDDTLTVDDIKHFDCDGEYYFFVEVDLKYPTDLDIDHQDLPLAPEKLVSWLSDEKLVSNESSWLSDYCSHLKSKRSAIVPKLIETVFDKKLYL